MRVFVLLALLLATLTGCDETPTGRSQIALVPDVMMADIGRQAFDQRRAAAPTLGDAKTKARVQCIANALADSAETTYPGATQPQRWQVVVFEDASPNAFALPGGGIGVHTGMLDVAETPAQLAAVIGHEMGHVLANHGNERLTQKLGLSAVMLVVGLMSEGEVGHESLMQALGLGTQLGIALPFSRAHEQEADQMGLAIMANAGFDPEQSVRLWQNMAAISSGQPPELLSTHPAHASRIDGLRRHMEAARASFQSVSPASCHG
ncbi:M48 family metallopeptidase [Halomonas sp. V046]|uniref:M48 family metallopeptidase n=1 Tax=Halomonas sp. V046 TaxID=3459611 RepID=UPI0040449B4C